LQDPLKFTQIWIFGLKTNHLATLLSPTKNETQLKKFAHTGNYLKNIDLNTGVEFDPQRKTNCSL
jgi:hypothetical protein